MRDRRCPLYALGFLEGAAVVVRLALCLMLSGCVVSAHHISDPRVGNDSFDYACVGVEHELASGLSARVDGCRNLIESNRHSEFVHASIEYRPFRKSE